MRKLGFAAVLGLLALGAGLFYLSRPTSALVTGQLSVAAATSGKDDPRWDRVTTPRTFMFPDDHGPHQEYQTEWWYFTGNLRAENGHELGFQLTFFRRGLDPEPAQRASRWATRNTYLAHFTVSDLTNNRFYAAERFSRDGAALAGASGNPFRVWIGKWQATGSGPEALSMRLEAAADEMAIDLQLQSTKPPTLQGDRGYSPKGRGPGNASYYYSMTRMTTTGTVTVKGTPYQISEGATWMDHDWGTWRLDANVPGWDWFGLHLSDGREITCARFRRSDGTPAPETYAMVTAADGTTTLLGLEDVTLDVLQYWTSPRSGGRYPAGWRLRIPKAGLDLRITPRMADQELPLLSVVYWEGAVAVEGQTLAAGGTATSVAGRGYVELTGYLPSSGRGTSR